MLVPPPKSCDTFVYVGAPILHKSKKLLTGTGTLFGKNSDRPCEERHEVIRVRPRSYESTTSQKEEHVVQCTYINVPQDKKTLDCVLSRPCWMWGCEMGANECGVVGGNEAVHTLLANELDTRDENGALTKRLLGMDILRLALERGTSAKHAVEVCIHFIETYGQGGPCCNEDMEWTYENSFLFADQTEAYVIETAGIKHWAWERIPPGDFRNISNGISIRDNWGAISKDIQSICKGNGWWDGETKFDWKRALAAGANDVEYDHNTQSLWDIWRERALNEAKKRRDLLSDREKRALKEMEIAAISILEPCEENFSPASSSTFAAFVQKEIDLIRDKF